MAHETNSTLCKLFLYPWISLSKKEMKDLTESPGKEFL